MPRRISISSSMWLRKMPICLTASAVVSALLPTSNHVPLVLLKMKSMISAPRAGVDLQVGALGDHRAIDRAVAQPAGDGRVDPAFLFVDDALVGQRALQRACPSQR